MDNYPTLLDQTTAALPANCDPDGPHMRHALLLAAHAGAAAHTSRGTAVADWDLFTVAITDAVDTAQAGPADEMLLVDALPAPGPDSPALRTAVTTLVRRLADLYATAATGQSDGQAGRRLVWAQVALRLDEALAELS